MCNTKQITENTPTTNTEYFFTEIDTLSLWRYTRDDECISLVDSGITVACECEQVYNDAAQEYQDAENPKYERGVHINDVGNVFTVPGIDLDDVPILHNIGHSITDVRQFIDKIGKIEIEFKNIFGDLYGNISDKELDQLVMKCGLRIQLEIKMILGTSITQDDINALPKKFSIVPKCVIQKSDDKKQCVWIDCLADNSNPSFMFSIPVLGYERVNTKYRK